MIGHGLFETFYTGSIKHFNYMTVTLKDGGYLQDSESQENSFIEKER